MKPVDSVKPDENFKAYAAKVYLARCIFALVTSSLVFVCTFIGVIQGLLAIPSELTPERGAKIFKLFTVNSNLVAAIGAGAMIPFAIDGVKKMRYSIPKWVTRLHYAGTMCVTLTMIFAFALILPAQGESAVTGMNFWLHAFCPIFNILLFIFIESERKLTLKDSFICLIPFLVYACIYFVMVAVIGEDHGGWRDIYKLITYVPVWVALPAMFALAFGISELLRFLHNSVTTTRKVRSAKYIIEQISDKTREDLLADAEKMGEYYQSKRDNKEVVIPRELLALYAQNFGDNDINDANELCHKFLDGALKEIEEYKAKKNNK